MNNLVTLLLTLSHLVAECPEGLEVRVIVSKLFPEQGFEGFNQQAKGEVHRDDVASLVIQVKKLLDEESHLSLDVRL